MTTVTVTISTAITIAKVRKAVIPRWKAWRERNHAAYLLQKKAYRSRNRDSIREKDRERKRLQRRAGPGPVHARAQAISRGRE